MPDTVLLFDTETGTKGINFSHFIKLVSSEGRPTVTVNIVYQMETYVVENNEAERGMRSTMLVKMPPQIGWPRKAS